VVVFPISSRRAASAVHSTQVVFRTEIGQLLDMTPSVQGEHLGASRPPVVVPGAATAAESAECLSEVSGRAGVVGAECRAKWLGEFSSEAERVAGCQVSRAGN